jgi:hypothetical protein
MISRQILGSMADQQWRLEGLALEEWTMTLVVAQ